MEIHAVEPEPSIWQQQWLFHNKIGDFFFHIDTLNEMLVKKVRVYYKHQNKNNVDYLKMVQGKCNPYLCNYTICCFNIGRLQFTRQCFSLKHILLERKGSCMT